MVNMLDAQVPVTPAGSHVAVVPVATVVEQVKLVIGLFIHNVCALVPAVELSAMVLFAFTVIVPVAILDPPVHPPAMVTV